MFNKKMAKQVYPNFFSTFFIFPFEICTDETGKFISTISKAEHWNEKQWELKHGIDYNDCMYFYPFIRDVLFFLNAKKSGSGICNGMSSFEYIRTPEKDNRYSVTFIEKPEPDDRSEKDNENSDSNEEKTISLPLNNVRLHIFNEIGIGVLIYEIVNDVEKTQNELSVHDYLAFLSMGRRVYPPFVRSDVELTEEFNTSVLENNSNSGKHVIDENGILKSGGAVETGEYTNNVTLSTHASSKRKKLYIQSDGKIKPALSHIITDILDVGDFTYEKGSYFPVIDDRMFTHSYFSIPKIKNENKTKNTHFINTLSKFMNQIPGKFTYEQNDACDLWYQMIFTDRILPSCQNLVMLQDKLRDSTYTRWSDWGTFYGFSRYSSVTVSDIDKAGYLYNHFKTMYYHVAILLCFYRGALLHFSTQSEEMASKMNENNKTDRKNKLKEFFTGIDDLHKKFILFRNKYWFREVTAQDQGIEIFDLWSSKMRNTELLHDVEGQIKELYIYANGQVDKKTEKAITAITKIGLFFLPLAFTASIFGMNVYLLTNLKTLFGQTMEKIFPIGHVWSDLAGVVLFMAISVILTHFIYKLCKKNNKQK